MAGSERTLSPAETARWTRVGMLAAFAIALGYLETFIPLPIPGVKLGLANIAILVALAQRDTSGACCIALIKVLAAGFLFGNPLTMAYSAAGTLLALAVMIPLSRLKTMRLAMTSVVGALAHEAGQLIVAMLILGTPLIWYSAPVLMIAGCVTGLLCGILAERTVALLYSPAGNQTRPQTSPHPNATRVAKATTGDTGVRKSTATAARTMPTANTKTATAITGTFPASCAIPALGLFLVYLLLALHTSSMPGLAIALAIAFGACIAGRVPARAFGWALKPFFFILLITAVAQIACNPAGALIVQLGPIAITDEALLQTAVMCLRLLAITAASIAIMYLVGTEALIGSIASLLHPLEKVGIRTQGFVLALEVALQTVPTIAQETIERFGESGVRAWRDELPQLIARAWQQA